MMENDRETENSPNNRGDESKSRAPLSRTKKVLLIAAGILFLLLAAAGTYAFAFYNQIQETQRVLLDTGTISNEEEYDVSEVFPDHIVNIALLGFDRGWNREALGEYLFRPDMLAVLSIDFESDEISVVRIPRDSYVPIYGRGGFHDKINHSFYYGYRYGDGEDEEAEGIRYTLMTVSNVLGGIPIHYYVSVDMYSIIALVDAMGGVYYEVETEIIDKHWIVGRVLVPEGPQIMDGKTFLRFLQYRDDETHQDYGRIDRQMDLLKETFYYLREQGRITDIPATYRIYKDYVETDLTYKQIAALAYYARDINMTDENLHFYTVTGRGAMKDGIWYQVIDQSRRLEIIREMFGFDADRWPPIVLVDSPEYLAEQERLRQEEEFGTSFNSGEAEGGLGFNFKFRDQDEDEDLTEETDVRSNMAVIPEVRGMSVDEARARLQSAGFNVGSVRSKYYDYLAAGRVIQAEPLSGSMVLRGETINLVVSDGPEPDEDE
jgi:polyisoprenyl-teichoic acid--peptidoglycan teichoic acid transferase